VSDTITARRWDSVKGSITTELINDKPYRLFRLQVHSPQHGWKAQAVAVPVDRLERYDWLYGRTLDFLARDMGIWDPQ
jgi:hypothetical protein